MREAGIRRTALLGLAYQGVYATTQLVALALLVRYAGNERYGLWMTVLALTTWVPLANCGQSSVLLTRLGAVAFVDARAARRIFFASLSIVAVASAALLLLIGLAGQILPWDALLNANRPAGVALSTSTAVAALITATISVPAMLGPYAVFAHQRGDLVHSIMATACIAVLVLSAAAIQSGAPLWLAGSLTLAGPLLGGAALWAIGLRQGLVPAPLPPCLDIATVRSLSAAGIAFLLVDGSMLVLLRTPDVVVARLFGTESVGPFASVGRLPMLMLALFQAVLMPFWPALGEAAHTGDRAWIRRIAGKSLMLVLAMSCLAVAGILLAGPAFLRAWMGSPDYANPALIVAACAQTVGQALLAWVWILMGGLSLHRPLAATCALAALAYLPCAYVLGASVGPVAVAWAQACALLLLAFPLGAALVWRHIADPSA